MPADCVMSTELSDFPNHAYSRKSVSYSCDQCEERFNSNETLEAHIAEVHETLGSRARSREYKAAKAASMKNLKKDTKNPKKSSIYESVEPIIKLEFNPKMCSICNKMLSSIFNKLIHEGKCGKKHFCEKCDSF